MYSCRSAPSTAGKVVGVADDFFTSMNSSLHDNVMTTQVDDLLGGVIKSSDTHVAGAGASYPRHREITA